MRQARILIFAHDGRGLGHLRRLSMVGRTLQGPASVLFLTGHREAAWLISAECEFVHIPSLDSLDSRRTKQWGRMPFLLDSALGMRLRSSLIRESIAAFQPDAIILDFLPLGIAEEMADVLTEFPVCRKYLVLRGMLGDPTVVHKNILTPSALSAMSTMYDAILVTADKAVVDVGAEYSLPEEVMEKLVYVGYTHHTISQSDIDEARIGRVKLSSRKWVVCSVGGGKEGEALIDECWRIAQLFPECYFDIVVGSKSRLGAMQEISLDDDRVRLVPHNSATLQVMHAAADIVICLGGYNTLLEACSSQAYIISCPIETDYEQVENVRRFSQYRQLYHLKSVSLLSEALELALINPAVLNNFNTLDLNGITTAARFILSDLASIVQ